MRKNNINRAASTPGAEAGAAAPSLQDWLTQSPAVISKNNPNYVHSGPADVDANEQNNSGFINILSIFDIGLLVSKVVVGSPEIQWQALSPASIYYDPGVMLMALLQDKGTRFNNTPAVFIFDETGVVTNGGNTDTSIEIIVNSGSQAAPLLGFGLFLQQKNYLNGTQSVAWADTFGLQSFTASFKTANAALFVPAVKKQSTLEGVATENFSVTNNFTVTIGSSFDTGSTTEATFVPSAAMDGLLSGSNVQVYVFPIIVSVDNYRVMWAAIFGDDMLGMMQGIVTNLNQPIS